MWKIELRSRPVFVYCEEFNNTPKKYSPFSVLDIKGLTSMEILHHLRMIPERESIIFMTSESLLNFSSDIVEGARGTYFGRLCRFDICREVPMSTAPFIRMKTLENTSRGEVLISRSLIGENSLSNDSNYFYVSVAEGYSTSTDNNCSECYIPVVNKGVRYVGDGYRR